MVGIEELARLRRRKRELVARSEANRAALDAECENLRGAAEAIDRGVSIVRAARPFLALAAPLLGFLAVRKWRKVSGLAARLSAGWGTARTLYSVWRNFQGRDGG